MNIQYISNPSPQVELWPYKQKMPPKVVRAISEIGFESSGFESSGIKKVDIKPLGVRTKYGNGVCVCVEIIMTGEVRYGVIHREALTNDVRYFTIDEIKYRRGEIKYQPTYQCFPEKIS